MTGVFDDGNVKSYMKMQKIQLKLTFKNALIIVYHINNIIIKDIWNKTIYEIISIVLQALNNNNANNNW